MLEFFEQMIAALIQGYAKSHPDGPEKALAVVSNIVNTGLAQHASGQAITLGVVTADAVQAIAGAVVTNNAGNANVEAIANAVEQVAGNAAAGNATTGTTVAAEAIHAVETVEPSVEPIIATGEAVVGIVSPDVQADIAAVQAAEQKLAND